MSTKGIILSVLGVLLIMAIKTLYTAPKKAANYLTLFRGSERLYMLPENLLVRLAQQESYFDPLATNPSGAQGMMQIIPRFHPGVDPFKPEEAVPYAAKFLAAQYDRFGSWRAALAAYNWGPGNLQKALRQANGNLEAVLNIATGTAPKETRQYVKGITDDVSVV